MTVFERAISVVAGVLTIANAFYAFPELFTTDSPEWIEHISSMMIVTRVSLLVMLEISLAHAFGLVYGFVADITDDEILSGVLFAFIAVTSAWISVFNIDIFLLHGVEPLGGPLESFFRFFWWLYILILFVIVGGLTAFFAYAHTEKKYKNGEVAGYIQSGAFALLFIPYLYTVG